MPSADELLRTIACQTDPRWALMLAQQWMEDNAASVSQTADAAKKQTGRANGGLGAGTVYVAAVEMAGELVLTNELGAVAEAQPPRVAAPSETVDWDEIIASQPAPPYGWRGA